VGKSARGLFVVMAMGRLLGVCGTLELGLLERGCFFALLSGELLRAISFDVFLGEQNLKLH
jgi:hypothetical protein